jgi:hypothetical protein
MAEAKTKPTSESVQQFIDRIPNKEMRKDCITLSEMMKEVTGFTPKMWGPSIVGFGEYHYKYESGHEGDICLVGYSPRKQNLSLYVLTGFTGQAGLLSKLGKHKAGKGCLYVKKLEDINLTILEDLIKGSVEFLKKKFGGKKS